MSATTRTGSSEHSARTSTPSRHRPPASPRPIRSTTCSRVGSCISSRRWSVRLVFHLRARGRRARAARLEEPPPGRDRSADVKLGQGITGWVAEHRQPVAVSQHAFQDPRFQVFNELPEDRYEAFLSVPVQSRGKLVGVINVQHRTPHQHGEREIQLISTVGFLVGAEIEMARLETENTSALRATRVAQGRRPRQGDSAARPRHERGRRLPDDSAPEPPAPQVEEGNRRGHHSRPTSFGRGAIASKLFG